MQMKMFENTNYSFDNQDLFNGLPEDIQRIVNDNKRRFQFMAGDPIFKEGDLPQGIYRVREGKVKKFTATNFGTEHIFYICKENEYLGYHALLSEELYADSASALTDCDIEFISKNYFNLALEKSHTLTQRLLKSLSHEFGVFLNATKLLAKHTVRERTALNLLILDYKFKDENSESAEIRVNREDLANMVGTATESLVRMLKDYKQEELIRTNGRSIFIINHQGLLKVSNTSYPH